MNIHIKFKHEDTTINVWKNPKQTEIKQMNNTNLIQTLIIT